MSTSTSPASYGQEALWLIHQEPAASAIYNIGMGLHIYSPVSPALLQAIFEALAQRHPALRTTLTLQNEQLLQVIHEQQAICFEQIDCSGQDWEALQPTLQQYRERPFDLEQGPLWRVALFTLSPVHHVLWFQAHHSIADMWSYMVILDELITLYQAVKAQSDALLPSMDGSYTQFAQWQRDRLDASGERLRAYWHQELSGDLPTLELPTDAPRSPVQTFQSANYRLKLETELRGRLRALARREGASFYAVVLAVFQLLLHRYSGQPELLTGIPTAGREEKAFDRTVGYFVNTLLLRSTLEADDPVDFRTFLHRVQAALSGVVENRDYPFPWLIRELSTRRDMSRAPLCQTMVVLLRPQDVGEDVLRLVKGETVQVADLNLAFAGFWQMVRDLDLILELTERTDGLLAEFRYRPDLFEASTIARMAGHFRQLLEGVVDNPDQLVSHLPLLTEAERHQLLVERNATETDYPRSQLAHQLVEAQAAQRPLAHAVVDPRLNLSLTYGELNQRANQLAHYLRRLGVGPDVIVAVCMERSLDMLVAYLAVLKAGGAYTPIDASYPAERIEFIVSDTQTPVLLTQSQVAERLAVSSCQVLCLDRDGSLVAGESLANPEPLASLDHLAYVIYTSGSTGQPKGSQIPHRSLLNLIFWYQRVMEMNAGDRIAQLAGTSFDVSVSDIWPCLTAGAALYLPWVELLHEPEHLQAWLVTHGITKSFVVTPVAESLLNLAWPPETALQAMMAGGEKLHRVPAPHHPFRYINGYGPSECTVLSVSCVVPPDEKTDMIPPIGRPVANTQLYVLDAHLQPVPIGVYGELCISGDCVGRGYLNRPDLTDERFVPHPFRDEPGARLYKTGDLVRYLPSGELEYLGRADGQVKIRGFRIELGEIETVLASHAGIQSATALVWETGQTPGEKRLVAYVVADGEDPPAPDDLRGYLKQKLPAYMVPGAFVWLETLPLTPNGKVDRRALPAPDWRGVEADYLGPRTPTEEVVASIWAEVLEVERVGVLDDFFAMGGHSLLATQITSRIKSTFGLSLPVRALFEYPTIARLAERIEDDQLVLDLQGVSASTASEIAQDEAAPEDEIVL
ncbi:MAG: hypothetical protein ETSY1_37550 [Candidatus Entotheonella factor]|uniref:Carrier domain-containing protein n=1 Tax=Entotheonella factor TaxID=1429438 RepID=W4L7F6_ENTF1|nr:MAG: hypothetical protein ETSY1_37550 [Candidatus Entotheonella factor]